MTRPAVFNVAGGSEADLAVNSYEVRASANFVCGAGGTVLATATATLNLASGISAATDVVGRLRVADGATAVYDGLDDIATIIPADAGFGGRGKVVATIAKSGLVPGKTYTLQFLITKNQPVGPLYPRFMRIAGVTS
ncbi:hypothetical protein DIE17_03915 [Burkholderia sp. Bp9099]|nr:hypothetical protein DIE17_03915 [Burkholderia sp. Bp9099]